MEAYRLTVSEKNSLEGVKYDGVQYYNPVQDINDNWFISTQEVDNTTNPECLWVKDLPLENFVPVPPTPPNG